MRVFLLSIFVCTCYLSFATDYVFTGSGDYSDPANWAGGLVPPTTLPSGSTITINGTAITSSSQELQDLGENDGVITVSVGGSLTLNNGTQFSNAGSVIVNGTLVSNTTFEAYPGSSITISGTFDNQGWIGNDGTITINGGTWQNKNTGTLDNTFGIPDFPGIIVVDCGGSIDNSGIFNVGNTTFNDCSAGLTNSGTLAGNSTVTGNLTNAGILAPGNSPGLYTVTGNYSATATATHNFEIEGTTFAEYDRLDVTGTATLGGVLNVSLGGGYTPSGAYDLPIITASSITGTFSSVNLPVGYTIVYNSNNVTLRFGTPLPVSLINFKASAVENAIQLKWQTAYEENNVGFYIERSVNSRDWQSLSFIAGHGTSFIVEDYSYNDMNPLPGVNYYRLKQLDLDGNYKYSAIVSANAKTSDRLVLNPNPAKGKLYFLLPQTGRILIFNANGQTILSKELNHNQNIDLPNLNSGEYIIQLHGKDGSIQSEKFIVD
jgi:hypothetical protein